MTNVIVIAILVLVLGLAIGYIIKAKKRGVKCIGCPAGGCGSCAQNGGCGGNSSCGCHTDAE